MATTYVERGALGSRAGGMPAAPSAFAAEARRANESGNESYLASVSKGVSLRASDRGGSCRALSSSSSRFPLADPDGDPLRLFRNRRTTRARSRSTGRGWPRVSWQPARAPGRAPRVTPPLAPRRRAARKGSLGPVALT